MFMINLFIGVIFYNFSVASKRTKHKFLTDSQYYWLHLQKFIIFAEPNFEINKPNNLSFKSYLYIIVHNKFFEYFIYISLILNILVLAIPYDGAPFEYISTLYYLHYAFNIIFIIEAFLKISLNGFQSYLKYLYSII